MKYAVHALVILELLVLVACSTHVSSERISGTYVVAYSFGRSTLVLQRDGTFVQTVEINGESAVIVRGSWRFDSKNSTIDLHGLIPVVDAFGHLKTNWREIEDLDGQPVERLWLRIEIETNESYGYVKR